MNVLPRPSFVVKQDQLSSEMRNVRAYFYDATTRMMLRFSVGTSERVLRCYHVNPLFLSCKTVEHRSRKSRDLLQTGEFTVSFQ